MVKKKIGKFHNYLRRQKYLEYKYRQGTIPYGIRIKRDTLNLITQLAKENNISTAGYIKQIIYKFMDFKLKKQNVDKR